MRYLPAFLLLLVGLPATAQVKKLQPVRINYMMRGYFYASSKGPTDLNGSGGWGRSSNGSSPSPIRATLPGIEILVDRLVVVPLNDTHEGRTVIVRNNGPDTVYFAAQDSRLYMKAQAMKDRVFRDIEYLPSSWCGNSYHTLFLAPGEQWQFVMPKYDGPLTTSLRLELAYRTTPEQSEQRITYSHVFTGAVHPKQFTKKLDYEPGGLLDPYND